MQLQSLMTIAKFMNRVQLQGSEVDEFAQARTALNADIQAASKAVIKDAAAAQAYPSQALPLAARQSKGK